ncbi:MarR family winged helix-turn-helix transcriptional regulator [Hwanghaeella sp.]|uniref:MarR family winged helix-turn-helix transcriptional regulator n=1 Tax=Hwanghaeella sp. TaxID=2605943 RepID=UPI003CCC1F43
MMRPDLPLEVTREVRDRCLCLHLQRAARSVARKFDEVLRPFGLTNGQFSLLISLNRPEPPRINDVAGLLAMDRTTLTANLKPLQKRGLIEVRVDEKDKRGRRLVLTDSGRDVLKEAVPVWRQTHDDLDSLLKSTSPDTLREGLIDLT